ncbi:hypothetical protein TNCV_3361401 [Trichonephila clavipes]|nr:hypothetical protein TNCV_3361401 [Trichonephila clavipes]
MFQTVVEFERKLKFWPNLIKVKDRESELAREAIQSGDRRTIFGQCVSRVIVHYPVEIWLWSSPEGKEGQLAPTLRRCSAGCLKYRQCVLEECESDIQYSLIPKYPVKDQCGGAYKASVQHPLSTVSPDSNLTIVVLQKDA